VVMDSGEGEGMEEGVDKGGWPRGGEGTERRQRNWREGFVAAAELSSSPTHFPPSFMEAVAL
jgi:hypothetical protein